MDARGPGRIGGLPALVLLVATTALAASCGQGATIRREALDRSREIRFPSSDGVMLDGRLFGEGRVGVVLSHMRPADQSSWFDFALRLADDGYLALTYDFRGYCPGGDAGCSEGDVDISAIWRDVEGAMAFLREQGAVRILLVGASMGGTASLVAAAQEGADVAAVVTLSAPTSIEGLVADASVLQRVSGAKLFIAGSGDVAAAEAVQQLYQWSPPPKEPVIVTSDDHGTDLLTGNQAEVVRKAILGYLEQHGGTG